MTSHVCTGAIALITLAASVSMCPAAFAEEVQIVPSPANRAARSVAFPAWGQLTNGRTAKTAALFALETYLVTGLIAESRRGGADQKSADAATDETTVDYYEGQADAHYDRRRNLLFWTILTVFYGVIDAYVDAYLVDFDEELEDRRELFGMVDPVESTVGVGFRF